MPTGPAYGRSPGDPYFDPVWSRLNEAGATIAMHIMPNWYFQAISPAWGYDPDPASWHMSAWQWNNLYGERPVVDSLSSLIFDNLFGRQPNLRVVVSEHGAEWVPHTVRHMDKSRGMGRAGPWKGGKLTDRPSEIFRRHVRVAPYPEDDIPRIVDQLGFDDCIVMGTDYPHAEGLVEPRSFEKLLDPMSDDVKHRILRTNAEDVFAAHGVNPGCATGNSSQRRVEPCATGAPKSPRRLPNCRSLEVCCCTLRDSWSSPLCSWCCS